MRALLHHRLRPQSIGHRRVSRKPESGAFSIFSPRITGARSDPEVAIPTETWWAAHASPASDVAARPNAFISRESKDVARQSQKTARPETTGATRDDCARFSHGNSELREA